MEVMEGSATYTLTPAPVGEVVAPGYKQTEVGVIPEDWRVTSLAALADVRSGGTPNTVQARFWDGDILWCTPTDITGLHGRKYLEDTARKITTLGLRSSSAEIIPPQSVVMTSRATIGECAINRVSLATNQGFKNFIPHDDVEVEFLYYLLLTQRQGFVSLCGGSTFLEIGKRQLASYTVSFPPSKAEQEAIAEALSDADALIESMQQLIAKKRAIKQGAMQELLTGERRLPAFNGAWEVKRLGEVAHIKTGSRNNQDKVEDGEYPFFVRSATVERIGGYSHDCEAILVPGEGDIGSIFHYIDGRFDVHQRVYAITRFSSDVLGKYVYLYMTVRFGAHAMQNSVKATVDSLRLPTFQEFEIRLPPSVDEQTAIATVLSDMDAEIETLVTRLAKIRALKQGMMQVLLTGRIRLI